MDVISFKPGHDGHIAYTQAGTLIFNHEAEKNSRRRFSEIEVETLLDSFVACSSEPDVYAFSGWARGSPEGKGTLGGYLGINPPEISESRILGRYKTIVTSSHERSHILCSYALSPFPQGQRCYALTWEGYIGSFYLIDENACITKLKEVMVAPGNRYAFFYGLADPSFTLTNGQIRMSDAGKQMALVGYSNADTPSSEEHELLELVFSNPSEKFSLDKKDFKKFAIYNSGVDSEISKRVARFSSSYIFEFFKGRIAPLINERLPLLISGGCGLNCDWNRAWLDSGIFSDVFVPPCPNDSGVAIGAAADAQLFFSGNAKLAWSVYCGQEFCDDIGIEDINSIRCFQKKDIASEGIAKLLSEGKILGWVAGRMEMGPRALGNRSILASPFNEEMVARLNKIKRRESFRPIAPVCIEDDSYLYFDGPKISPHMLYFSKVKTEAFKAITHVDGSARVQTVNENQNPPLFKLLNCFKKITGYGMLCNTSLNFNGCGFINSLSDLSVYADEAGLDGFVVNGTAFVRNI